MKRHLDGVAVPRAAGALRSGDLLRDRVVLVTGGSGGIGAAICEAMAGELADVAVHYNSNRGRAEAVAKSLTADGSRALAVRADLTKAADVREMYKTVKRELGTVDVLVNNAGVSLMRLMVLTRDDEWDDLIDTNLKSAFLTSRAFVRDRLRSKRQGAIVNIASVAGLVGAVGLSTYGAAKAGVISLTRSWGRELAEHGIRVNAIAPGPVDTPMMHGLSEEFQARVLNQIPMNRIGLPHEVAAMAVFLASDRASFITGEVVRVDGGQNS